MDHCKTIRNTDHGDHNLAQETCYYLEEDAKTAATAISHKRFHSTTEDLSRAIRDLEEVQNSGKFQCLEMYCYMNLYMKQRGGGADILKRRFATLSDNRGKLQRKSDSHDTVDENALSRRQPKLALRKLGKTKDDLTYAINQIKFFSSYHRFLCRKSHIFGNKTQEALESGDQDENIEEAINSWENFMFKLKNSKLGNETLIPTLFESQSPVEKLVLNDIVSISQNNRKRQGRKIAMIKKKEEAMGKKRKLIWQQISQTPPWKWEWKGRYFENVPSIPFVWRSIFAQLDTEDKMSLRLVSHHWKGLVDFYCIFSYNAVLTDETIKQVDESLCEFNALSVGPLLNKIPESWKPRCFAEVKKLTFRHSVSQENVELLCLLFQHLPFLGCENAIGFEWVFQNVRGFHDYHQFGWVIQNVHGFRDYQMGGSILQPFGGKHLTRLEMCFTTFCPWHCTLFCGMLISDFSSLQDFAVKYTVTSSQKGFGWAGQSRNHFYEAYLGIFSFVAIHLHSLRKVTLWFSILAKTDKYDALPYAADLPWLPGFPHYDRLTTALATGSLEDIDVHLCPWEQRGVFFWSLCLKLIQVQSKLKRVTIRNMGLTLPVTIFDESASTLESISISYPSDTFSCALINQCTNLKEFEFADKLWKMGALDNIDQISQSVEKLTLNIYLYKLPDQIENWIISNMINVEEIVLSGWANPHVAVTYLRLPKLKTLTLENCYETSVREIKSMCTSHSPEVRIRYEKKRTRPAGTLVFEIVRQDKEEYPAN